MKKHQKKYFSCTLIPLFLVCLFSFQAEARDPMTFIVTKKTGIPIANVMPLSTDLINDDTIIISGDTLEGATHMGGDWGAIKNIYNGLRLNLVFQSKTAIMIDYAFANTKWISNFEASDVPIMGIGSFQDSEITSVRLPKTTTVGKSTFLRCHSLKSADLPNLTSGGESFFQECAALESVLLPALTSIGSPNSFLKCTSLKKISLPAIKAISSFAFQECTSLEIVDFPELTSVSGTEVFKNCISLRSVSMPKATLISTFTFQGCGSLESITLPSVEAVGADAFSGCSILKEITLPRVKLINDRAFQQCVTLHHLNLPNTAPRLAVADTFSGVPQPIRITTETAGATGYTQNNWVYLKTRVNLDLWISKKDGVAINTNNTFLLNGGTVYIEGDGLEDATGDWTQLRNLFANSSQYNTLQLVLNPKTTAIPEGALSNAVTLKSVSADNVLQIGSQAFSGCTQLTYLSLPDQAPILGSGVFNGVAGRTLRISTPETNDIGYSSANGWPAEAKINGTPVIYLPPRTESTDIQPIPDTSSDVSPVLVTLRSAFARLNQDLAPHSVNPITSVPVTLGTPITELLSSDILLSKQEQLNRAMTPPTLDVSSIPNFIATIKLSAKTNGNVLALSYTLYDKYFENWDSLSQNEKLSAMENSNLLFSFRLSGQTQPMVGTGAPISWDQALQSGAVTVNNSALSIKYIVADAVGSPVISDGFLMIPDGIIDGKIIDPLWVSKKQTDSSPTPTENDSIYSESSGSGGCTGFGGSFPALFLLLLIPLTTVARNSKK